MAKKQKQKKTQIILEDIKDSLQIIENAGIAKPKTKKEGNKKNAKYELPFITI